MKTVNIKSRNQKKMVLVIKTLLSIFLLITSVSCKNNSENNFKGKWVNTKTERNKIVISGNGENYTVNINDTGKYSAFEYNDTLKIIIGNDTINGKVDSENHLIINNESFVKKNKRYTNPGAGIY